MEKRKQIGYLIVLLIICCNSVIKCDNSVRTFITDKELTIFPNTQIGVNFSNDTEINNQTEVTTTADADTTFENDNKTVYGVSSTEQPPIGFKPQPNYFEENYPSTEQPPFGSKPQPSNFGVNNPTNNFGVNYPPNTNRGFTPNNSQFGQNNQFRQSAITGYQTPYYDRTRDSIINVNGQNIFFLGPNNQIHAVNAFGTVRPFIQTPPTGGIGGGFGGGYGYGGVVVPQPGVEPVMKPGDSKPICSSLIKGLCGGAPGG